MGNWVGQRNRKASEISGFKRDLSEVKVETREKLRDPLNDKTRAPLVLESHSRFLLGFASRFEGGASYLMLE